MLIDPLGRLRGIFESDEAGQQRGCSQAFIMKLVPSETCSSKAILSTPGSLEPLHVLRRGCHR